MRINSETLTPAENLLLIERIRDKRLSLPLVAVDSDAVGDKHTEASWGMCTVDPEIITPDLRIWPDRELSNGQVYGARTHGHCPFDKRPTGDGYGCYYSCRIFQDGLKNEAKARELFDIRIAQLKAEGPQS